MGKIRADKYKQPSCPYCNKEILILTESHIEACYRWETFCLLKKILEKLNGVD